MRSKKAIYNIVSNLFLQVIVVLYGFIVPKIIISSYGSNVNGLVSSITQFLAYITLLESGFGPVVKATLYKPIANKDKDTIANILKTSEKFFKTIALIFIVYVIGLSFLYPLLVSNDFSYLYTISLIVIIAISTFAEYFFGMTYKLYLQADQKTYVISIIQIVTYLFSTIVIILLAKFGASIQILKLGSGIIFVLRPLIQNFYVKKKYKIDFKHADKNYELKQKWEGLAQHIASVIHSNTDVTVLTFFCSLSEVSVYSVYYLVVKGIKSIIQAFSNGIDASFGDMIARKEKENLRRKFGIYETIYFTICTIVFSCTMILITPFVQLYTEGINDANYIRPIFGYLIVISEYIWAIRLPYSSLTLAAGHFRETRNGAWVEAISNIVLSVILVNKFGIIGVAIGTIIGMTIRTIEFVYHTNKYILERNAITSVKKIFFVIIDTTIIMVISNFIPLLSNTSYLSWLINAFLVATLISLITVTINFIFFRKEFLDILKVLSKFKNKKQTVKEEIITHKVDEITLPKEETIPIKEENNLSYEVSLDNEIKLPIINDSKTISDLIRDDNNYIKHIDFNYHYDFDISQLIMNETKIYNFVFNNDNFLRNNKYPAVLTNNRSFIKYVLDKDFNNIAYIDTFYFGDEALNKIIDYAFRKIYFKQQEGEHIYFDINLLTNNNIIENSYFKECLKYIKKY